MGATYSGKYTPKNKDKYVGDVKNVVYRSSWERAFFRYCDKNPSILNWAAEEVIVPYVSPLDGRRHRYFIDVWIRYVDDNGDVKQKLIEIKPYSQTLPPKKNKRNTKRYLREIETYAKNQAKWEAARRFADKKGIEFTVLTEKDTKLFR